VDFKEEMKQRGLWLDFAPREELDDWLESAAALLVVMRFEPALRRRMETSFPSKLVEYVQLGKPIVIWGPEYCSAVRWARLADSALCVTDPSPRALVVALEKLSEVELAQMAVKSRSAAENEFKAEVIQKQFLAALHKAAGRRISSSVVHTVNA
jgi:hypothetical protein